MHAAGRTAHHPRRLPVVLLLTVLSCGWLKAQPGFEVLHSFSSPQQGGAFPINALLEVQPGLFYGAADGLSTLPGTTVLFTLASQGSYTVRNALARKYGSGTVGMIEASDGSLFISNLLSTGRRSPSSILKSDLQGNATIFVSQTALLGGGPCGLVEPGDGMLYGVATGGESSGIFFSVTLAGQLTVLHTFSSEEGTPSGAPLRASDGNFYGETSYGGGAYGAGTLYRISASGAFATLYSFTGAADGNLPSGGLVQARDGDLYGVTEFGGNASASGTIFKSTLSGALATLYSFSGPDGTDLIAGLMEATDGNLYGAASAGGTSGAGTIFRLTPAGAFRVIHDLDGASDGSNIQAALVQGSDGSLYGVAANSGPSDYGTAFRLNVDLLKPLPAIRFLQPDSGVPGDQILLNGTNLLGPTAVLFNGMPATFASRGGHYVLAQVPAGATSGPITISTANGTAASPGVFVVQ